MLAKYRSNLPIHQHLKYVGFLLATGLAFNALDYLIHYKSFHELVKQLGILMHLKQTS